MKRAMIVATLLASAPVLQGCLVADVAGVAIGVTGAAVGAVGGAAIDLVTTDEDERQQQEIDQLKKDNEELRKRQQASKPQ
jgi:single-stranded DNA-specific DHH superfamily exonuclease